jgi:hypothetical protein
MFAKRLSQAPMSSVEPRRHIVETALYLFVGQFQDPL